MTSVPLWPVDQVSPERLAGFHELEAEQGTAYRWSEPCAGVWMAPGAGEIRVRLLTGRRRLNVWEDLDIFIGEERLDHHHVDFDSSSWELVLTPPARDDEPGPHGSWLVWLASPHTIAGEPRSLGLPVCGFRFRPPERAPPAGAAAAPGESFLAVLSRLFQSSRYRDHLRRRMGTCAADWDQREAHAQYDLTVHARRFASRASKLSFDMFMAYGGSLELPVRDEPLVSIVVVTFNRAELTYQCLRSVTEQAVGPYEVIIVDNGSTDRTGELLDRVCGPRVIANEANTGFLRGANQGAGAARGEFVLFLNNDTQLLPGCCANALETIRSGADIGAVGARLITFQGVLQEAGGIVWADGSTEHYGRGGRADAGEYMFERTVDYCSGAFLLTPAALFRRLGGFDEVYAPGYYEDTDYCLRLRESGYRTVYAPGSAVLHHEYASQGDGGAAGIIERNRAVFAARHASALAGAGQRSREAVVHARARDPWQSRVLYVADFLPPDPDNPEWAAAAQAARTLVSRGRFVTLFASDPKPFDWERLRRRVTATVEVIPDVGWPQAGNFLAGRPGFYQAVVVRGRTNRERFAAMVPAGEREAVRVFSSIDDLVNDG